VVRGAGESFRLMVNRSVSLGRLGRRVACIGTPGLNEADFDLSLTGFDPKELDDLLLGHEDGEKANAVPPLPENPAAWLDDLWLCGDPPHQHRVLCSDATSPEAVARLLSERRPFLMVYDPPYGISPDSEWRDRAGLNGCGPAEASYMKHRTEGHTETTISGNTRSDWSEAFELVPSLQIAYVWHASIFAREVLSGLLRIGFLYPQQIIWNKGRTVLTRTHYWYAHEPCWYVRKKDAPWFGKVGENSTIWDSASPNFMMGGCDEERFDHPTQKPVELMRRPILNHTKRGRTRLRAVPGKRHHARGRGADGARLRRLELDPECGRGDYQVAISERPEGHTRWRCPDFQRDRRGIRPGPSIQTIQKTCGSLAVLYAKPQLSAGASRWADPATVRYFLRADPTEFRSAEVG
jgi:hypothetical protein